MIEPATLLEFLLASALIELTPGPNMTWLTLVAATHGRRPGFEAVLGVALGLVIIGILAGLGLSVIIARSEVLYQMLRWAGVVYFLYLGWEAWQSASADEMAVEAGQGGRYFRRGLVNNLLNPKAGLFYVAILPTFINPAEAVGVQTLVLTLVYVGLATAIHLLLVLLAGRAQPWLGTAGRRRATQRFFAVAMVGLAAWLILRT